MAHDDATDTGGADAEVLQALLHAAPDAIIAVDDGGRIVYANEQTERLFGWARHELVGRPVEDLVPERYRAGHPGLRRAYATDSTARPMGTGLTLTARRHDGSEFPIEISLSPIDTASGRLHAAAIRDVTVARRIEQKFRAVLASAPDAMVGVDADGVIQLVNAQAERIFGWPAALLVGQPIETLIPPGVAERHADLRHAYMADPVTRPMGAGIRLAGKRRDGSVFPTEISLSSMENEHGDTMVLAAVRDVTDRVELEAERQRQALAAQQEQSQRLESLGQLAGGIAHDFNNLLSVILGYVTLAARQTDPIKVREDLAVIGQAAERATTLTKQLLAFGRRDHTHPEVLVVRELIEQFTELIDRTIGDHIEVQAVRGREDLVVVADRSRLEQVLLNLAINARDAMPDGGVLTLAADPAVVGDETAAAHPHLEPGPFVRLRVSDTGTGMPPEVVARAFDPFFTTKPRGEGTGLGLASAYGIVTSSGGTIVVDSTPGQGTTMSVLLPAASPHLLDEMDGGYRDRPSRGHVLVVEDEDALRSATARMLTDAGYEVATAPGALVALDMVGSLARRVDLVLTDVSMPKMSGTELARELGRRHPYVRVVFMSGYAEPSANLHDDTPLLAKPFTETALLDAVAAALQR